MKRRYILGGFILSVLIHFFILPVILKRVNIERDFSYPKDDKYIEFFSIEDIIIPVKKAKKTAVKKQEKEENIAKKKKEYAVKKKDTMEDVGTYNYRSVPIINPNQKFSIKRNKKPKGSEKLGEVNTPQMTIPQKHLGIAKHLGTHNIGTRKIELPQIAKKHAQTSIVTHRAKAQMAKRLKARSPVPKALTVPPAMGEKATIASAPLFEDKSFAKQHVKKSVKKLKSYSIWDSFSAKDFNATKDKKTKDTLDSMPKLSMITPPKINDSITLKNTLESRNLIRGEIFDIGELQKSLGGIGSFLGGKSKSIRNFGSLTIGDPDFSNEWYARVIVSKVAQHWYLPIIAYSGASGIITISFSIKRSGEISNQSTSRTSDYPSIDESSSNAVRLSGDFPPLPEDYSKDKLDIKFSFYVNIVPKSRRHQNRKN